MTAGRAWGIVWTVIPVATIAGFALTEFQGSQFPNDLAPNAFHVFFVAALAGLVVSQFIVLAVRVGIEDRAQRALRDARRQLAAVRKDLATLKTSFGFSMDDWARLQREKIALEQLVKYKLEGAEPDNAGLEDADLKDDDDDDCEEIEASDFRVHGR
jgi:hypothetical protein